MIQVHAIVFYSPLERVPPFRFNRSSRSCAAIVFGGHLRKDAVAQAESRITKAGEMEALQQFPVAPGACANDLGATRANPGHLCSLLEGLASNLFDNAADHVACRVSRGAALARPRQVVGHSSQGRRRAG